ncbi:MAG: hypothetical protein C4327_07285 [Meiothermus sp.]
MHNLPDDAQHLKQEVEAYLARTREARTLARPEASATLEAGARRLQRLLEEVADYNPDLSDPLPSLRQVFTKLKAQLDPLLPSGPVQRVRVAASPPPPLLHPEATIRKAEHGWWLERAGERTPYQDLEALARTVGTSTVLTDDLDLWRASLRASKACPLLGCRVSLALSDEP